MSNYENKTDIEDIKNEDIKNEDIKNEDKREYQDFYKIDYLDKVKIDKPIQQTSAVIEQKKSKKYNKINESVDQVFTIFETNRSVNVGHKLTKQEIDNSEILQLHTERIDGFIAKVRSKKINFKKVKALKLMAENIEGNNFIENAILEDIKSKNLEKIITRFPPEPNGHFHIGHTKAVCIDFLTGSKFGGRTNLRFDDTNPAKESVEYEISIKKDIKWLGFKWSKLRWASKYYEKTFDCAVDLILQGKAYVCDLNADQIREGRGTLTSAGTNSPYRERSVLENLELFLKMRAGVFEDGERTLRAKIDMASPNMNMRDPIMYRILRETHYKAGNKWCIYPMYDFAHPIGDAIEGITHSLCTMEFEDHRPLYNWFMDNIRILGKKPRQIEFSRLEIENTVMSKRFLKIMVDKNIVDGWDDPRLPTLCGLRRKGIPAEAILDFCSKIGVAKSNSVVAPHILDACVRENLNHTATRVMAIVDPIKLTITNYMDDVLENINISNNPTKKDSKKHICVFSKNLYIEREDFMEEKAPKFHRLYPSGIVRLMGGYVVKCDNFIKEDGKIVEIECSVVADATLKPKATIHWVSKEGSTPIKIKKYNSLLKDGESFDDSRLDEIINENSLEILDGLIENFAIKLKKTERLQFIRNGYYYPDKTSNKNEIIYNQIVSLKDSK